jgi:hypothetical protein
VPFDDRVEFFIQAFQKIGYRETDNRAFEFGYQKVAIYTASDRTVNHMARQRFWGGGWLSKCGALEDIVHPDLECLQGDPSPLAAANGSYGEVTQVLKRGWWVAAVNLCLFRCCWVAFRFLLYRIAHPSWILSNIRRRG